VDEFDGLTLARFCERYGVAAVLEAIAEFCATEGATAARAGDRAAARWDAAAHAIEDLARTLDLPRPGSALDD
jgi:hypothetical protein